jgi:IclR family acetate operon transcriptional repressor
MKSVGSQISKKIPRATSSGRHDKSFLAVAEKLFLTLEIFTGYREGELTLDQVTRKTGLPKSTTFRLLSSLEKCGYLSQNKESGRYSLGDRFFDLASSTLPYNRLISIVRPYLNSLVLTFAESVNLGVYDEGMVAIIFTIDSPQPFRAAATVGSRSYLHCTSMGKALASYMDQPTLQQVFLKLGLPARTRHTLTTEEALFRELEKIREAGVSHDNQEDVEGVECYGAALLGADGKPIACMSVSGPSIRMGPKAESIRVAVREAARRMSLALGWMPPAIHDEE